MVLDYPFPSSPGTLERGDVNGPIQVDRLIRALNLGSWSVGTDNERILPCPSFSMPGSSC
jgi:hypothetical protein